MFFKEGSEFAGLVHFDHDIRAADEFSGNIELREGGPLAEFLEAHAEVVAFQDVDIGKVDAEVVEDTNGAGGEAAHGLGCGAFHVEHDGGAADLGFDLGFEFGREVFHGVFP